MLKKERQREILNMLQGATKVEVDELAGKMSVSLMTIRRDLAELSEQGLIERVHGGALSPVTLRRGGDLPVVERSKDKAEIKQRIGRATAALIKNGEKVFIGSGSTAAAVAEALTLRRNLTVLTNALNVANTLLDRPEIKVAVIGGFLRRSELSLIGYFAENSLQGLQVDKVIIGIEGIDPVKGLTNDYMEEVLTDRSILGLSKNVIVVADHSKFGRVAAVRGAPITAASMIVTDVGAPKDMVQILRQLNVKVLEV